MESSTEAESDAGDRQNHNKAKGRKAPASKTKTKTMGKGKEKTKAKTMGKEKTKTKMKTQGKGKEKTKPPKGAASPRKSIFSLRRRKETPKGKEKEKKKKQEEQEDDEVRPSGQVTCFFPQSLVEALEAAVADEAAADEERRRRRARLRRRVRRRLDLCLQGADAQRRAGMALLGASGRLPTGLPLHPRLLAAWERGRLPVHARDPAVLVRLFTWLLGLEEVLETLGGPRAEWLRRQMRAELAPEDEVAAVRTLMERSRRAGDCAAALKILANQRRFKDFVAAAALADRRRATLASVRGLKAAVQWQLEALCLRNYPMNA